MDREDNSVRDQLEEQKARLKWAVAFSGGFRAHLLLPPRFESEPRKYIQEPLSPHREGSRVIEDTAKDRPRFACYIFVIPVPRRYIPV